MKTIKDRAQEFAEREYITNAYERERIEFGYYHGAKEQRAIDIEKIVEYAEIFNKQNEEFGIDARIDVESTRKWAASILLGDEFDEYLISKIKQATPVWKDVDADEYIKQIRGNDN